MNPLSPEDDKVFKSQLLDWLNNFDNRLAITLLPKEIDETEILKSKINELKSHKFDNALNNIKIEDNTFKTKLIQWLRDNKEELIEPEKQPKIIDNIKRELGIYVAPVQNQEGLIKESSPRVLAPVQNYEELAKVRGGSRKRKSKPRKSKRKKTKRIKSKRRL